MKFKIVEKTGSKIEEILHKSDSWSNRDCGRQDCLLCQSATEEERKGLCKRRNVVYETYCITCSEKEEKKKEEKDLYIVNCDEINKKVTSTDTMNGKRKREKDELHPEKKKVKRERNKKEYRVEYVGETGRSANEHGSEHLSDFLNFEEGSHMLKHYLACHRDMKMCDVKLGMKVRNSFRSALERQIGEAVAIDIEKRRGKQLMNSKSEYNRCTIPRITTKSIKETMEETEKEMADEKKMKLEIKNMKKLKGGKREKKR